MPCRMIHRVSGDLGPPITVEYPGAIITGWTITARFEKPSGLEYTLAAVIDEAGDGADVPAEFHFEFTAGNLTKGDHLFDLHFVGAGFADYSTPSKKSLVMRVR